MSLKGLNLFSNKFMSSRSSMTCTYKCGNACFGECGNQSDNVYFGDVMSRRSALRAGSLTVVSVGGAAALAACSRPTRPPPPRPPAPAPPPARTWKRPLSRACGSSPSR